MTTDTKYKSSIYNPKKKVWDKNFYLNVQVNLLLKQK